MNTKRSLDQPNVRRSVRRFLQRFASLPYFLVQYRRSSKRIVSDQRRNYFTQFLEAAQGPCLQIAVKDEIGKKFGDNWISVDKYDHSTVIDRHDDVECLEFPNDSFNAIACWSVLEHVPHPAVAVGELFRVLRPGGHIWVQLPFLYPYRNRPVSTASPAD